MVFPIFIFILKENCLSKSYDPLTYHFITFLYFAKFRVLHFFMSQIFYLGSSCLRFFPKIFRILHDIFFVV
jgi:hypothetical protein